MPALIHSPTANQDNLPRRDPTTQSQHDPHHVPILGHNTDRILVVYMFAVVIVTIYVLVRADPASDTLNLRIWLIVNAVLTVLRALFRIAFHSFPRHRLNRLRIALIWALRVLTVVSMAWFIVGIVFLAQRSDDADNGVVRVVTGLIILEVALLVLCGLLCIIIFLFALRPVLANHRNTPAATKEDLAKLRTFKFAQPEGADDTAATCTICLSEYQKDEVLRELPCATGNHVFHAACVDEWLMKKLSCPICRDDPLHKTKPAAEGEDSPV